MDQPVGNPNFTPVPPPESTLPPPEQSAAVPVAEGLQAPEVTQNQQVEKAVERGGNINQKQPGASSGVSLPPVQAPVSPPPATTTQQDDQADDTTPLIADDVDVIEMEWVNKAKEIIKKTKQDPHAQEQAVEKLQIDYLKKRYGRDVKSSRSG